MCPGIALTFLDNVQDSWGPLPLVWLMDSERLGGTRTMTDVNAAAKLRPERVTMPVSSETQLFEELFILLKLWGNIHNMKLTVLAIFQCIVLWH